MSFASWTPFADGDAATPWAFDSRWTELHRSDNSSSASLASLYTTAGLTPSRATCTFDPCAMVSAISVARSQLSSNDTTIPVLRSAFSSTFSSVATTLSGMSSGVSGYPLPQPSGSTYRRHYRLGSSASTPEWTSEMSATTLGASAASAPRIALDLSMTTTRIAAFGAAHPSEPILWAGAFGGNYYMWMLYNMSQRTLATGPSATSDYSFYPTLGGTAASNGVLFTQESGALAYSALFANARAASPNAASVVDGTSPGVTILCG